MTRVLLHAGFHKTGTTSAQDFLDRNRALIRPYAAILLHPPLTSVAHWVRDYALLPDRRRLQVITEEFAEALAREPLDGRDLIISHEELCGPMPLGDAAQAYPHAVPLLGALIAAFWGAGLTDLHLHFSLRDQAEWVNSVYSHQVRKQSKVRLTEDRDRFTARLMACRLEDQVAAIRAALPDIPITASDLAQAEGVFGPAQPFVAFLRLPPVVTARLSPPHRLMVAPDRELLARMLELNRSDLPDEALAAAKKALLQGGKQAKDAAT